MQNNLKEIRTNRKVSQAELAEKSGVSRQTIIAIENGTRISVTTNTLVKLAKALDCSVEDIFCCP